NEHEAYTKATTSFDITEEQAKAAMDHAESKKNARYSVYFYNCAHFARDVAKAAGQSPPKVGTMNIAYPNKLYKSILAWDKKNKGDNTIWGVGEGTEAKSKKELKKEYKDEKRESKKDDDASVGGESAWTFGGADDGAGGGGAGAYLDEDGLDI
ncbi:MAG: hypothetical protein AAFV07_18125, partial [Bacteroidota bacterium]